MRFMRGRRLIVITLLLAAVAGVAWLAATTYDHAHSDELAKGIRIDGVDVGGLSAAEATERVRRLAVAPRQRDIRVTADDGKTFVLTASALRVRADVEAAVSRAVAASHPGWLGRRVADDLSGKRVDLKIPLTLTHAHGAVGKFLDQVDAATRKAPVDAGVQPSAEGLNQVPGHAGVEVDRTVLQGRLSSAIKSPAQGGEVAAPMRPVAPKVSSEELAQRYPAYIVVDRKAHKLRFFEHLSLAHTYDIAVGRAGLETPAGLYKVQWREANPSWHVPNSKWAGKLAGKTIPPGPDNPIKARWLAFNGGAGIHGIAPSEYGSIGHDASHGCVRMRIPDVISLYARSPVGTPVFVA